MPELPEVESTVVYLRERMVGQTITGAQVHWARTIDRPSVRGFRKGISGAVVQAVSRRGKYFILSLRSSTGLNRCLVGHLRMSGSVDIVDRAAPRAKHDRLILELGNGKEFRFNDPRKFGRLYFVDHESEVTGKLGREPFDPLITSEIFWQGLQAKKTRIKSLLLDQRFLAGVGNIYADESLWRARLHPQRQACSLNRREAERLLVEIRAVLNEAIAANGTDVGDNVVVYGQFEPRAYGRDGEPCMRCKSILKRAVVGQRGTHFCPKCQRLK